MIAKIQLLEGIALVSFIGWWVDPWARSWKCRVQEWVAHCELFRRVSSKRFTQRRRIGNMIEICEQRSVYKNHRIMSLSFGQAMLVPFLASMSYTLVSLWKSNVAWFHRLYDRFPMISKWYSQWLLVGTFQIGTFPFSMRLRTTHCQGCIPGWRRQERWPFCQTTGGCKHQTGSLETLEVLKGVFLFVSSKLGWVCDTCSGVQWVCFQFPNEAHCIVWHSFALVELGSHSAGALQLFPRLRIQMEAI